MNIKVVTTYNNNLYHKYAHRFFNTYNWPFEIITYNEDESFFDLVPECKNFVETNKNRTFDSYLFDGVRFCYKVYAFTHAILNVKADGLICMDADSVFYKPIDVDFVKKYLHKDNCMMTYLGRKQYSECGFLYFNLSHPYIKDYAKKCKEYYDTNSLYSLKEYHDCEVWDTVRKELEKEYDVLNINLTPNFDIYFGHAQAASVLGEYYDHCKGDAKILGKSPENKKL
jgi:hypothetical protein